MSLVPGDLCMHVSGLQALDRLRGSGDVSSVHELGRSGYYSHYLRSSPRWSNELNVPEGSISSCMVSRLDVFIVVSTCTFDHVFSADDQFTADLLLVNGPQRHVLLACGDSLGWAEEKDFVAILQGGEEEAP